MKTTTLSRQLIAIAAAAAALRQGVALAQEAARDERGALPSVTISGKRASLISAQERKREASDIVDVVVAEEIDKLPDLSVSEALQRVTGVQIARDRGEGTGVTIRGLSQMETTLNGREVFTAGTGRSLDFVDLPAEIVSSLNVYKSAAANQIEGGVGGVIDIQTRRPFDFSGRRLAASARANHGDLVKSSANQWSVLASDRWRLGGGELGALVSLVHQRRSWREDQKTSGAPKARQDLVAGQSVIVPDGTTESTSLGAREREAASAVLQWRPNSALELYAEGSYASFRTLQDTYQIVLTAAPTFVPGSVALFPGTSDLQRVTWINAPLSVLSFARDTVDRNRQLALGGRWRARGLTVKADVSRTDSHNHLYFVGPVLAGVAARFSHDLSTSVPSTAVSGTDLLNPASLRYSSVAYRTRPFDGKLSAAQLDADYQPASGWFDTLSAGLRYASRRAGNAPGLVFADTAVTGIGVADKPGLASANPYPDFLPGAGGASIGHYLAGNLGMARDAPALRQALGITAAIPAGGSALGLWDIGERTQAGYLKASFKAAVLALDGHAGLRVVRTRESVRGAQAVPATGSVVPIAVDSSYTDYLPSLQLRHRLSEGFQLRVAASRSVTRPDFNQLSPSLTLVRNTITPSLNQGAAGNPDLKPVRSRNLDLALERYYNATDSAYATVFNKQVDGFVSTVGSTESYDGVSYLVNRPHNSLRARINGAELGFQRFFDFAPDALRGLGLQANYTLVDSSTPHSTLGPGRPLQNLSRHSANLVGMLERKALSARLAYSWRSKFLSGATSVVGLGALPVYTAGYGWLDGSLSYRFSPHLTLTLEGSNLLRTVRRAYYGVETRPQSAWMNDRQISLMAAIRL